MSLPPRVLLLPLLAAIAFGSVAHGQRVEERIDRAQQAERAAEARAAQERRVSARGHQELRRERRQGRRQDSMAESIRHVRRANRGQILSAERMHAGGREINRIKMVDDRGRVRVFEDDPQRRRSERSRRDDD